MEKFPALSALPLLTLLLTLPALVLLCHAALHDIAARTIPDLDSLLLGALGLLVRVLHNQVFGASAVAVGALVVGQLLWSRRWIGGGDVKLIAACCCLVAPAEVPGLLGGILCAGGALGLAYLAGSLVLRRGAARPGRQTGWRRVVRLEAWRIRRRLKLPYGVAIAAMTMITLLNE